MNKVLSPNRRHPDWIKVRIPSDSHALWLEKMIERLNLNTVCKEARCPNRGECFAHGNATIMILGDTCTRACRFCNVNHSKTPPPIDPDEPRRVALAVKKARLRYVVITSVDRDDLEDGGAFHFAQTIRELHNMCPDTKIEVLIPDYVGKSLQIVVDASPDVLAHNIEVVERLTPMVRDKKASYRRSIQVLREASKLKSDMKIKSSLMVGLGETFDEVCQSLSDIRDAGAHVVTIGQYLQPSSRNIQVIRYWTLEEFERIREVAYRMGFEYVFSGPLVRSSYMAEMALVSNANQY